MSEQSVCVPFVARTFFGSWIMSAAGCAALLATTSLAQQVVPRGSIGNFRPINIAVGTGVGSPVAFMAGSDGLTGVEPYRLTLGLQPTLIANLASAGGSFPDEITPLNNQKVFFTARTSAFERELYYYDTSTPAPVPLNINPTAMGSFPAELTGLDPTRILFSANDGTNGRELWISDGTPTGTVMVKDIQTGGASSSPHNLIALGSNVLFAAIEPTGGTELWISNGTSTGTVRLVDLVVGAGSSYPGEMARLGNLVYFAATTTGDGRELWVTDGTLAGTQMAANVRPGPADSAPDQLTPDPVNGVLAFTAVDPIYGRSLYVLQANQTLVRSSIPLAVSIDHLTPTLLPITGGAFVFAIDTPALGRELGGFVSAWGAHTVVDVRPGPLGSSPSNFRGRSSTRVLFRANNGVTGHEIWELHLPTVTALPVANIKPDSTVPESSYASPFVPFGSGFLFAAQDGSSGIELWTTNGTATTRVADVNPTPPVHRLHGTFNAPNATYEVTDAAPFSVGALAVSASQPPPFPIPLGFLGFSGMLVVSPPLATVIFLTDAGGNGSVSFPFPALPPATIGVLGAQAFVLNGATGAISDVAVETKGSCSNSGFTASAEGEANDDTQEYRIKLHRTDSNPGTAYFALVYTSPTGEKLLLEGGEGSLSLEAGESTEVSGFFDFYSVEESSDGTGTKILELWMLPVPPTPQNYTTGCKVWESYC